LIALLLASGLLGGHTAALMVLRLASRLSKPSSVEMVCKVLCEWQHTTGNEMVLGNPNV
jgi:hypothetical protein